MFLLDKGVMVVGMKTKKTRRHWSHRIAATGACGGALRWARRQPTFAVAWERCEYPGWLAYCLAGYRPRSNLYWRLVGMPAGEKSSSAESRIDKARCGWIRANYKRPKLPAVGTPDWVKRA